MINEFHWQIPTKIHGGTNHMSECHRYCHDLGMLRPLIVTDKGLKENPLCENLLKQLEENGLQPKLTAEIHSNPTCDNINQGVDSFRRHRADGVIAVGGGSALDAGKAIALMVNQTLPITHFIDEGNRWQDATGTIFPVIAIPTTAGTGSEVGRCAVVIEPSSKRKLVIFHPALLPAHVILDPCLTVSLPPHLTAFTGMDALSHNLEAICVKNFNPMCDGIASLGIQMIAQNLTKAFHEPNNLEARTHMLVASSMGATAFQKGLGAMHALSHAIGGLYGGHHGMLNAILMPYVLTFNRPAIEDVCCSLAKLLNLPSPSFDAFLEWVLALRAELEVPHTLDGLYDFDIDRIAHNAMLDACHPSNPIELDKASYERIFSSAISGDLTSHFCGKNSKLKA